MKEKQQKINVKISSSLTNSVRVQKSQKENRKIILGLNPYDFFTGTLTWQALTTGGAIRIAVRQLLQTWKLRHYDVTDDVISPKL